MSREASKRSEILDRIASHDKIAALRLITENTTDYIMVVDRELRIVFINRTVPDLTIEEVIGTRVDLYTPETFRPEILACYEQVSTTRAPGRVDLEYVAKDGSRSHFETRVDPVIWEDDVIAFVVTATDNTSRRETEEALRASEARHRALIASNPDMMFRIGRDGELRDYHAGDVSQLVFPPGEVIGTNVADMPLEEVKLAAIREAIEAALGGQGLQCVEYSLPGPDGDRDYEARIVASGEDEVTAAVREVTAQRRGEQERKRLHEKLQQVQKLESLGVLAGGIAHDFNNLLTGVLGNASIVRSRLPEDSELQPLLGRVETAAIRAAELCQQMLAYAGRGEIDLTSIDLSSLVDEMVQMLRLSISKKAQLELDLPAGLPRMNGDRSKLGQVVMNLLTNASDSLGDDTGEIRIQTGVQSCDSAYLSGSYLPDSLPEGDYVFVEITDTGQGMDEETLPRIFDPFFTTKFTGRGLGLAAVIGIVRGHGGTMRISSHPERGTMFRVLFPVCTEGEESPSETPSQDDLAGRSAMVMVVDDEEIVRDIAGDALRDAGFEVMVAHDGAEALELLDETDGVDVVLLDLKMPRLGGLDVLARLRERSRRVGVVVSSGDSLRDRQKTLEAMGVVSFLQKPYSADELVRIVDAELARVSHPAALRR